MRLIKRIKSSWDFLKEDTWQSWIVSLILIILFIKFILFPGLSLATGSELPLVVIESCSMYHANSFEDWWNENGAWYESVGINKESFSNFTFKNGLNKGDIILVTGVKKVPQLGEIIIFKPNLRSIARNPIIHRVVDRAPLQTKGDNNNNQLNSENNPQGVDETRIELDEQVIGKATLRIPALGWVKLIFFELQRPPELRGGCS